MPAPVAMDQVLRIPLLPVLAAQGLWVRRRAQMLPEPPGPRQGRMGQGPLLRLLIAGDSSAAGVGAPSQDEALSGQLVRQLAQDFTVEWRLEATTGHTTPDTLARLQDINGPFDIAVTALGVNDTTRATSQASFAAGQAALMQRLTSDLGARLVVATAVPHMALFPALPHPLAWVLGHQSQRLDRGLASVAARSAQVHHLKINFPADPVYAASDGYHPSPLAYALWASAVARVIRDQAERLI